MHADHAGITAAPAVKCPFSHKRITHRRIRQLRKSRHFVVRVRNNGTSAQIDKWFLSFREIRYHLFHLRFRIGHGSLYFPQSHRFKFADRRRYILCNIHQHRTGPTALRDIKRPPQGICKLFHIFHYIAMFGDRHGHTCNVNLLKAVLSQHGQRNVSRDGHHGDGIHKRCGNTCYKICSAGTACCQTHSHLSRGPGITVRRMRRSLFMGC